MLFSSQAPVDAVPPVVNVTAPADGATVSGTIDVTATATDDTGVAGVQLLIDGTNAGPEDTTSPYTLPWNTVGAANGPHTITARARDLGGNLTTSAPVTVTVTNTADSGLLAAYGMETGSGTTLTDSSPNAANAELTDGTWTTGRYGNAVAFNGTTTRARTSTNLNLGSAFTLQAWVNNPTNEAYETILTVGTAATCTWPGASCRSTPTPSPPRSAPSRRAAGSTSPSRTTARPCAPTSTGRRSEPPRTRRSHQSRHRSRPAPGSSARRTPTTSPAPSTRSASRAGPSPSPRS